MVFGLFKKKTASQPTPSAPPQPMAHSMAHPTPIPHSGNGQAPATAPSSGISYYPNLISELISDHGNLLSLYDHIMRSHAQRDFATLSAKLKEFGSLLRNHLLTENMRLYIYLQQRVAESEVDSALVRSFRKEMDAIAKTVIETLSKYDAMDERTDPALLYAFEKDMKQIAGVLVERVKREENTLYPLYVAAY